MFSALRQGSTIYVLCMEERPKLYVAQVTEFTNPVPKLNVTPPPFGQPMPMTVDIKATDGKTNFVFEKLDSNAKVFNYVGNSIVATNREDLNAEWDKILSASKHHVESTPYHQSVIDASDEILSILNPQYAKEQEREKKIGMLEQKMSGIENSLTSIESMISALSAGNVSASRKQTKE